MISSPAAAPPGARVFEARNSFVTAVRLSSANIDDVRHWIYVETGTDSLWNDGALYFTSPVGLAQAREGDYVVQTVLGFEAATQAVFGARYQLPTEPEPASMKKTEPNVATWISPEVSVTKDARRRYANPMCGPHKDAESFKGKTMVNPSTQATVARTQLDEFSVMSAFERAQQRRHAEARGEA